MVKGIEQAFKILSTHRLLHSYCNEMNQKQFTVFTQVENQIWKSKYLGAEMEELFTFLVNCLEQNKSINLTEVIGLNL